MAKKILIYTIFVIMAFSGAIYATENTEQRENVSVKAKIIKIIGTEQITIDDITQEIQSVRVEVLEGQFKGEKYDAKYTLSYDLDNKILAYELNKNNTVYIQITKTGDVVEEIIVQDIVRQNYIIIMVLIFCIIVILVGGKKGAKAILGLVITIFAIYFVTIKFIYRGYSPIAMSIITSFIIISITFIIMNGINKKTITAAIGTCGGVLFAGIMAFIFGNVAKLTGGQEEAIMLSMNTQNIIFNFRELLFAGIVISSLGACMDVGMSIASALDELKIQKNDITAKELFKSGMNIGKDVIGTMVNTLILVYVGSSLTLILLFMVNDMNLSDIINKEMIATEVISSIAGSMGVVFTIPITSFIYSVFNKNKVIFKRKSDDKIEGERSLKL